MANTGGFDVMLQFKQDIINDILVRVLNESLITNLHLKSPLSRVIDEPAPPTQVKVWWDKPELELDDADSITLSVDVTGGARQLVTERNLSVDGSVSITRKALYARDEMGAPYLYLEPPQPFDLHMSKLKVTYEGSKWPELLSRIDPTRETTVLRPLLTTALMIPLSHLPLSYNAESLPLSILSAKFPNSSPTPSEWNIPVTIAMMRVLKQADAVAMGLSLTETRCDYTLMTTAFPEEVKSNAALTLTSRGLNYIIGQLRRRGTLKGVITSSSREAQVNWRWEVLTIQCHQGYISLTGNFRRNAISTPVIADLKCSLDRNRSLTITPLAINTDEPTTETIVSSLYEVLRMILRARARKTREEDSEERGKLFQCFSIPGTQIQVEAPADDIIIEEGTFTLLYDVPQTLKGFQAEVPWPEPQVTISEPNIPMQTAPGTLVSMQMQAQLTTQSFPPYDYVWTTGPSGKPTLDRGPSMIVMGSPTPAEPGPQVYTNVHVKVIDTFGQVTEADAPARYQAQTRRQQRSSSARIAAIIVAIIILIFSGIGGFFLFQPTPSLSGPAEVIPGSVLQLHGSGFIAVGDVTFSLDGGALALSSNLSKTADSLQNRGLLITLAQLTQNGTILMDSSGNFDATINISTTLPLGTHSIHASEAVIGIGVRSADLMFNDVQQQTTVVSTDTPTPTPSPTATPSPTPVPPNLTVNPLTINANTDTNCSYGANNGWTCSVSLSSDASNQSNLNWSASSSGATFSPPNGILSPTNPTATVTLFVSAKTVCPAQIDLAFQGPANTEHVTWSCAAPTFTANEPSNCPPGTTPPANLFCTTVTLIEDSGSQGGLNWIASSDIQGVMFNPLSGPLYPNQPVTVTIFISCNTNSHFYFKGPANTATVRWNCVG